MAEWPLGDDPSGWPTVSVVMPVRNEAENLRTAVEAVLAQDYPRAFDVCLAVAPSHDETADLARELADAFEQVMVVDNTAGTTPAGLNVAVQSTRGEVVVRVDGHAKLSDGYFRRAVETMLRTGAVNVGGIQRAAGQAPFEEAVAAAMTSWLGTGGARFHVGGEPGPVDTVYLGVFRRDALEAVGLFDERLIRNQDYELNIRLRKAGGAIWFDRSLSVEYRPRGSLRALASQYHGYGWWKAEVARIHPRSLKLRQVMPVLLTGGIFGAVALPLTRIGRYLTKRGMHRFGRFITIGRLFPAVYLTTVMMISVGNYARSVGINRSPTGLGGFSLQRTIGVLLAVPTMHLCWGFGFLSSCLRSARTRRER